MSRCVRILRNFFLEDNKENVKRNYVWNVVAGFLNAAEAVILSMVITRVTNLNDVGILTIAFATANLFVTVGKYGVRSYQVTDSIETPFRTYLYARYLTVLLMIMISAVYLIRGIFVSSYSVYKAGCIFFMCLIFAVEAVEDVYWGYFHRIGRLDIGAKMFVIRWGGILLTYFVGILVTKNLFLTSGIAFVVSVVLFLFCKVSVVTVIYQGNQAEQIKKILRDCLPLCLSNFLNFYICNAPKYVIDRYMDDEVQACFGFVAMPVFVIELLSTFLYQPMIVGLAEKWNGGEIRKVIKGSLQQIFAIIGITIICVGGAYLIGIPILSLLFGTNLYEYKKELVIMVSGGGVLAVANFLVVLLTMMRKQIYIIGCYGIVMILAVLLFPKAVIAYQTCGVAIMYDILMLLLVIILGVVIVRIFHSNYNKCKK